MYQILVQKIVPQNPTPKNNLDTGSGISLAISKTIRRLIADAMASHLLEPRRMVIPMACSDVSKYKFPIPKHLLVLKVIEAKDSFTTV